MSKYDASYGGTEVLAVETRYTILILLCCQCDSTCTTIGVAISIVTTSLLQSIVF